MKMSVYKSRIFFHLVSVVLTFESLDEILSVTIAIEQSLFFVTVCFS